MLLGTDNDPLALNWNDTNVSSWGMPVLNSWNFYTPVINFGATEAFQYDFLRTYRDVDIISDAEILLLNRVDILKLYYGQFDFSAPGECATNRDLHGCPQLNLSPYTQQLKDASRAHLPKSQWFPHKYAVMTQDGYHAGYGPNPCTAFNPNQTSGHTTDQGILFQAGFDLMERIYALRLDLHTIVHPETGVIMDGLINPMKLRMALPPCQRETTFADTATLIIRGVLGSIMPYGGWIMLIPDVVEILNQREEMLQMIESYGLFINDVPAGIEAIMNQRRVDRLFIDTDNAKLIATNSTAINIAKSVGLPHPAMICSPDGPCSPNDQIELLQGLIDEWNTDRLLRRRVEYEKWRDDTLRDLIPDWNDHEWTKQLSQQPPYTGDCRWTPTSGVCQEGAAGFRNWAASVLPKLAPGPVPPAPSRSKPVFDRSTLDRTDTILHETAWLSPTIPADVVVDRPPIVDMLIDSITPVQDSNPIVNPELPYDGSSPVQLAEPKQEIPWAIIGAGLLMLL